MGTLADPTLSLDRPVPRITTGIAVNDQKLG